MKTATLAFLTACVAAAGLLTQCAPASSGGIGGKLAQESNNGILPAIKAPATIRYAGKTWQARHSAATPPAGDALVEYFLPGEGPGNWSQMVSLRLVAKDITPQSYAGNLAKANSAPGAGFHIPGGQAGYDTLIPIRGGGGLEFSVFRIAPQGSSPGVKVLQYSEKIPQQKMVSIGVNGLKTLKASHRESIKAAAFPSISLNGN